VRKKAKKAFFEAFRRSDDTKKGRTWWTPNESVGAAKGKDAGRNALRKHDMTAPPGRVALTFSREALVVIIVVGATLLIVSHVWGYKRGLAQPGVGTRRLVQEVQPESPAERDVAGVAQSDTSGRANDSVVLNISADRAIEPPFHTLRIYSGISLESARKIKADLLAKGYDAFVYKEPRYHGYTVNVGRFSSRRELQDSHLQLKLAVVYEDCFMIEVDNKEQIIP